MRDLENRGSSPEEGRAAGCGGPQAPAHAASEWDLAADVVVLGYGGAGAAAAIAAHDAGGEVLVLESSPRGGGNTLVSFGGIFYPEQVEPALFYLTALFRASGAELDPGLLRVFVEEAARIPEWLKDISPGVAIQNYGAASFPAVAGGEAVRRYVVKGKSRGATAFAQNLWQILSRAVQGERSITVLTETPARRLLTDRAGAVIGVLAQREGRELSIRARRGVVLSTGGYEFDPVLLQNSVKGNPIYALGHPGNRGDGVRMAQKAGAQLWHMNGVSCGLGVKTAEHEAALLIAVGGSGQILVDGDGKRFVNEGAMERHAGLLAVDYYDSAALCYPRIPCYLIFDEKTRRRGPVSPTAGLGDAGVRHVWSKDNLAEIEKGWIRKAESPGALARLLGMDETALEETVRGWNEGVRQGIDPLWGRRISGERQNETLDEGPFYALELYPCLLNTQGGPRRNEKGEILDPFGTPIPGLYGAGELGSLWGPIYQGGGNIAEGLVFGRIAGRNAAQARQR